MWAGSVRPTTTVRQSLAEVASIMTGTAMATGTSAGACDGAAAVTIKAMPNTADQAARWRTSWVSAVTAATMAKMSCVQPTIARASVAPESEPTTSVVRTSNLGRREAGFASAGTDCSVIARANGDGTVGSGQSLRERRRSSLALVLYCQQPSQFGMWRATTSKSLTLASLSSWALSACRASLHSWEPPTMPVLSPVDGPRFPAVGLFL